MNSMSSLVMHMLVCITVDSFLKIMETDTQPDVSLDVCEYEDFRLLLFLLLL